MKQSFFHSSVFLAAALLSLTLSARAEEKDFWSATALWKTGNPLFTEKGSRDFQSEGPMLRSIRVSKHVLRAGETCDTALAKVKNHPIGVPFAFGSPDRFRGWEKFSDDVDAVEGCSDFPCKVKFNEVETLLISAKPKEVRLAEVENQVEKRMQDYVKTSHRGGYDLPEDPVDPWKVFVTKGHVLPAGFEKSKPSFYTRKLKFGEGSYRPLRQMFDERVFTQKGKVVRVARDVYTAHYFDGWGEWLEARCSDNGKEIFILQDLLMEFDLLKNTDFFSRIARPKMRQGVDQESVKYQKSQIDSIF
ncbi:MAG: hypothetical protein H7301_09195 [Cryobacterium sp.]|nr:hypothetical protein [Oligoflexia bacterium]